MKLSQIFRSLFRNPLNSLIVVVSLSIGIACTNIILLFITRELGTDSFQQKRDRIYLLQCDSPYEKGTLMSNCKKGSAEYIKQNFSQVEDFCRIRYGRAQKIQIGSQVYNDNLAVFETSPSFFKIFSYKLLTNNPDSVFVAKDDIAISEDLAQKYFGEKMPVNRIITVLDGNTKTDYIIKGIFRKPVENSQFSFDMVKLSEDTERYAFLLLKKNADPSKLEKLFADELDKIPVFNDGAPGKYYLTGFKKRYFDTSEYSLLGNKRDKTDLLIALLIGVMIMCVASVNYLGLVNNRLVDKTPELHIRRINGGSRLKLAGDFMIENLIILGISYLLSLEVISWILPFFNRLTESRIDFIYFTRPYSLLYMLFVVLILWCVTLIFCIKKLNDQKISTYPKALIDNGGKKIKFPAFNIFQLMVTIVLLICSITIIKQINYITRKEIGIDKNVIEVKIPSEYESKTKIFKENLQKYPSVASISVTTASPLLEWIQTSFHYSQNGEDRQYSPKIFRGDEAFIKTLGITLTDGRDFSGNMIADKNNCIVNESLARYFSGRNLLGDKLPGYEKLTVIGIVKDFNCSGAKDPVSPEIIIFDNSGTHLLVMPLPGQSESLRKSISETWRKLIPDFPPDTESVRERYDWYHTRERNFARLIVSCCLISLFLSMIGLFAISFHSSRKRTKEIGIRKINGASVFGILSILNRDFFRWVIIAFIPASIISWYIMSRWLQGFAYRTDLNIAVFGLGLLLTVAITFSTVSWQSWKAATRNPIDALKYE
jgi:putative ABC transport system permease protein